jgi:predicted dehydrogenase
MTTIRTGVIGLGAIAQHYLAAIERLPGVELAAVCDPDEAALEPFAGRIKCYRHHADLLAEAGVDAVVVTAPNDVHFEICRDALTSGHPVCVEKPLGIRAAEGRELTRLAGSRSLPLFTAFHRRYNANVLALLRRLEADAPVQHLVVRYFERIEDHLGRDRWYLDPARCGGGCVADNGPNAFDLVHLFLGPVLLERATVGRDQRGVDRQAVVELRARSGATARVELDWSYDHGERKDVTATLADGSSHRADMLHGYPAFKSSLAHEYVAILEEFREVVGGRRDRWPDGLDALELVSAVYAGERQATGLATATAEPDGRWRKRAVEGEVVKVLTHRRRDRGMRLEEFASRCVRHGEVHELVATDHRETEPGARIDRVAFLGFAEIGRAGVLDRGDEVWIGQRRVGSLLGFDSCHFPNHYNLLIVMDEPATGSELGLEPGTPIRFLPGVALPE